MALLELRNNSVLRFRAILEIYDEKIRYRIIKILADFLDLEEKDMDSETDNVYRINLLKEEKIC